MKVNDMTASASANAATTRVMLYIALGYLPTDPGNERRAPAWSVVYRSAERVDDSYGPRCLNPRQLPARARPAAAGGLRPRERAGGSGHPTSSMSAADLMAVLLDGHLRLDYGDPGRPGQRPPDLLQGPRLAAATTRAQGGGGDRRRGAADASASSAGGSRATRRRVLPVDRRRHRLARPGPADRRRRRAGRASGSTGCPTALGAVRRLRDGRGLDVGGVRARRLTRASTT